MLVTLNLPDDLRDRVNAEAERRGVTTESLISDSVERAFPARVVDRGPLPFIGMAEVREDLAANYKQIRRDLMARARREVR